MFRGGWCCDGFSSAYGGIDDRGFAALVGKEGFLLQARSVAKADEHRFRAHSLDVPVSILARTGMRYCRWCGKKPAAVLAGVA